MLVIVIALSLVWVFIVFVLTLKWKAKYGNPFKSKLVWTMIIAAAALIVIMIRETLTQL